MKWDTRPEFMPAAIAAAPFDFVWKGDRQHIGPVETVTPLMNRLSGSTICAQVTLMAGLLVWAAWRLKPGAPEETQRFLQLAEAAFAYQVDKLYLDLGRPPHYNYSEDEFTPALSAAFEIEGFARKVMDARNYWDNYYIPVRETFHAAHLVNHTMPKSEKKTFETWLGDLADRLKTVAPKPDEPFRKLRDFPSREDYLAFVAPHRGVALPPEILDPRFAYDPSQRTELVARYLKDLDWQGNPFLRSPEAMLAAGFKGTPYQL
jgi:hypothetical protein